MTSSRWVKSESSLDDQDNVSFVKPGGPLKPRLDAVYGKIQVQVEKLGELDQCRRSKDEEMLRRLSIAIKENNVQQCTVLSAQMAKDRQIGRAIELSKVALEKLSVKLGSASDFADIVVILSPAMAVVKNLRSSIAPYLPEAEDEFGIISELLSGILVDAGQVGGYTINFETANEEAVRLIDEAALAVDQKMRDELPCIPEFSGIASQPAG